VVLAKADRQQGFFDAAWCSDLIPEASIYSLLAEHGDRIVCDEDFAECYSSSQGRPSIPPSLLAKVLLLAYRDGRRWRDISSADINAYVKDVVGADVSAKDFRTWHATVLAAVALAGKLDDRRSATATKRAVKAAMVEVAGYLGNTPTVARSSYVDPRVIDRYEDGATIAPTMARLGTGRRTPARVERDRDRIERAVLRLLRN